MGVKEMLDPTGWFQAGYGSPILYINENPLGLEMTGWGRLQILSHYRFPIETVDFYVGAYYLWRANDNAAWRLRLGHLSSHFGDGKESIVNGSMHYDTIVGAATHFASEFAELTFQEQLHPGDHFFWSVGVRAYIHQLTHLDSWFSVPASFAWYPMPFNPSQYPIAFFGSSGDGPFWPNISGGVRFEDHFARGGILDFQFSYYYGSSWAGVDAGALLHQLKLQVDVRDF